MTKNPIRLLLLSSVVAAFVVHSAVKSAPLDSRPLNCKTGLPTKLAEAHDSAQFDFSYQSSGEALVQDLGDTESAFPVRTHVKGMLSLSGKKNGDAWLSVQEPHVSIAVGDSESAAAAAELRQFLTAGFRFSTHGEVDTFSAPDARPLTPLTRNFAREIINLLNLPLPQSCLGWVRTDQGFVLTKKNPALQGETKLYFDSNNLIKAEQDTSFELKDQSKLLAKGRTKIYLTKVAGKTSQIPAPNVAVTEQSLDPEEDRRTAVRTRFEKVAATANIDQLAKELAHLAQPGIDDVSGGHLAQMMQTLKAIFITNEKASREIIDQLRGAPGKSLAFKTLVSNLAYCGTEFCQTELAQLAHERRLEAETVALILRAAAFIERPLPKILDLVVESARDPVQQTTGALVLGALIRTTKSAREVEPQVAAMLGRELSDLNLSKELRLAALGNAADPSLYSYLGQIEQEPLAKTRVKIVRATRFLEPASKEPALLALLINDSSPEVRAAAARQISSASASPAAINGLAEALNKDLAVPVRLAAVYALWELRDQHPAVLKMLAERAQIDPVPEVQVAIKRLLSTVE